MKEGEEDGRYTSRDEEMQGCGARLFVILLLLFNFEL